VGDEARGGVERRVGADRAERLRIERQPSLQALDAVHRDRARQVEPQHRHRVLHPFHVLGRVDAGPAIEQAFQPAAEALRAHRPAVIDRGHVGAKRPGQQQQDDQIEQNLQPALGLEQRRHSKNSGLNSVTTR